MNIYKGVEAVTWEYEVFCVACLPVGIRVENEDIEPIKSKSEDIAPICVECGRAHYYAKIRL